MITIAATLTVLLMVVTGLAMFRRLARFLLAGRHAELSECELLLMGILPGLALVGTLGTYLAVLHLLRIGFVAFLAIVILYVSRREVYAMLASLCGNAAGWFAQARQGNLFPLIAVTIGCAALSMGILLCAIPADNVDVWVFHIPLAQSFIAHHGFAVPQLDKLPFYSNQPNFFEILFAAAMLAVPDFIAANVVNVVILFGFLLFLLSFAKRARDLQFLIVCLIFLYWQNFLLGAAQPMTDMSRSCFSAAAYLFAYRYAGNFRCFDLVMSALMAGAAVAGKYTELVTPALIAVTLVPLMINKRATWIHMVLAALVFFAVAGVWYVKNAILVGNPIYPFVFGHRGLSDQWMTLYMQEMAHPFDVADRAFSTDFRTFRGWRDFASVLYTHFRPLENYALVSILGLALPQPRRWMLPLWCLALFVFWYAVMFNGMRWAMTAELLLLSTGFIVWVSIADRIAGTWNPQWPTMVLETMVGKLRSVSNPWTALASLAVMGFLAFGLMQLKRGDDHALLPGWMSQDLAAALVHRGGLERYLNASEPGYAMYRYIGQHDLRHVLQPFDNGAVSYVSAYNGGHPNDWVVRHDVLPGDASLTDDFVARNNIHYFIDQTLQDATQIERLGGPVHIAMAKAVIARLRPRAQLVFADGRGMALYQILPGNSPP